MNEFRRACATPVGAVLATSDGRALTALRFDDDAATLASGSARCAVLDDLAAWLDAYFEGSDVPFDRPLAPSGTPFQHEVWQALARIRHGETSSYAAIAAAIGRPTAVRAVGAANGRNPIAILIPCHRVIGANGALVGYAGGLARKRALLEIESRGRFALVA